MSDKKTEKIPVHYSDLSSLKKAWAGLWKTPTYTKEEVIELNKDFIKGFSEKNDKKVAKESEAVPLEI